jgi:hypothetical protein
MLLDFESRVRPVYLAIAMRRRSRVDLTADISAQRQNGVAADHRQHRIERPHVVGLRVSEVIHLASQALDKDSRLSTGLRKGSWLGCGFLPSALSSC